MSDLKPCPFCGEKPKLSKENIILCKHNYVVYCTNDFCGVQPYTKICPDEKQAIEAWNRRASDGKRQGTSGMAEQGYSDNPVTVL